MQIHTTLPTLVTKYGTLTNVEIRVESYLHGQGIAVQLYDDEGPWATLSVNLPESKSLPEGWFYAKTWSENEGLVEALVSAGVLETDPTRTARTGWVQAVACRLL